MRSVALAQQFAEYVHRNQKRKYTETPYVTHLAEVVGYLTTANPRFIAPQASYQIAWLHDVVEDCGVSYNLLEELFGPVITSGVRMLTDNEQGNRAERKAAANKRLASAPPWIQTIKLADLISNTRTIVQFDPKFAKIYLAEKQALLRVMTQGDHGLYELAHRLAYQPIPDA